MTSATTYRVWFDDPGGERRSVDVEDGIPAIREGFWVDVDMALNPILTAAVHWVPPARIVLVTKVRWDVEEPDSSYCGAGEDGAREAAPVMRPPETELHVAMRVALRAIVMTTGPGGLYENKFLCTAAREGLAGKGLRPPEPDAVQTYLRWCSGARFEPMSVMRAFVDGFNAGLAAATGKP